MVSASHVRELIRNYLAGALDLQRFADCFEAQYSELNAGGDQDALELGDRVEALLGRVSAGYSDENDLKSWLLPLSIDFAPPSVFMFGVAPVSQQVVGEFAFQGSFGASGTSPLMEPWKLESLPT
jgi:hypothetical protein